jgi:UPF0755 protein
VGARRARIAALAAVALVAAVLVFGLLLFQPFAGRGSGRVVVQVPHGLGASQIGDLLEQRGVVDSSFFFNLRTRLSGKRGNLRSGTFTLRRGMSYSAAIDALTAPPPPTRVVHVTIPEGLSRREAAPLVASAGVRGSYVAATLRAPGFPLRRYGAPASTHSLEGFLFPAPYDLKAHSPVRALVTKQLIAFQRNLAGVGLGYARHKQLTPYDVVTIASMVEREAQVDAERPLVAAVIYNRLHIKLPLGIDATLRYALADWTKPLTKSQLALPTPYNTRLHAGLPPTPIGNPGLASLRAAAHPAHTTFLYYVVKPGACGRHAFSSTNAQFLADVARYNAARAKAGGRSPTKC